MTEKTKQALMASFLGVAALGTFSGAMYLIIEEKNDDAMQERSRIYQATLTADQSASGTPTPLLVPNQTEYVDDVIDELFSPLSHYKFEQFNNNYNTVLTLNDQLNTARLTFRGKDEPTVIEVNPARSVKENAKDAKLLLESFKNFAGRLPEANLDKAAGVYEVKDGAVIFQAASQPDTAQVMSLPAQIAPTPGGPS